METYRNDVITRAAHIKPPKKDDVFAAVTALLDTDNAAISVEDMAKLYAYFLPRPPARAKTPMQWVAKAVAGKDDARHYLRYLYSDGTHLVATDGHRLHGIPTDLSAGFYDTALNPITVEAGYPDWRRVLPEENRSMDVAIDDLRTDIAGDHPIVNLIEDTWVRLRYLQATANGAPTVTVTAHVDGSHGVRFAGPFPGSFAVILPVRM